MIDGSEKRKPLVEVWISEFACNLNRNKPIPFQVVSLEVNKSMGHAQIGLLLTVNR